MSVVVVGASGAVGGRVVAGLVDQGVEVRAISRHPEKLAVSGPVRVFAADLDRPGSFADALAGAERLFLYADLADPEAFLTVVAEAGVRQVVLLSSASVTYPGAEADFNGSRFLRVERAVEASGLDHTFVRPGGFASNAKRWSWEVKARGCASVPYPDAVQVPVHESDIADVAVAALTGDALVGQAPVLTGPERLTVREQLRIIAEMIGRDLPVIQQTEAEAEAVLSRYLSDEWVHQIIKDLREAVGTSPAISDSYQEICGRPSRTFGSWVEENLSLFV